MLPRLLVVDDKPTFLSLFEKIVGDRMEVRTALSAEKALALIALERFDVVISDVRMPGMDGVELLRQIKAQSPDIAVILITAFGEIPDAVRAMQLGAFSYLTKPFDPDDVIRTLEQALRGRAASLAAQAPDATRGSTESSYLAELSYRQAVEVARERFTRDYLVEVLRMFHGNVTKAAQRAGIERESLHRLMRRYHLDAEDFRDKGEG
ncbi:MAG: response regulator [Polyangiaceae bacterium]